MKNSYLKRRFEESSKKNLDDLPLAFIWDRLAAFVLDLIIVSFMANVMLAPFRKKIQAAVLNEHEGAISFYVFCIIAGMSLIFIVYHTIAVYLFNKTIGKKIFNLEVAPIVYGQPITLMNAFVRASALLSSIVMFFFPLLEVFSNKLRRPMHDRLADSYVKGIGKTGGSPSLAERLWVRLAYVIVLANVAVIVLAQVLYFRDEVQSLSEFITQPEYLCDEVSLAKESWPKSEKVSRLDIALTLYGADAANEECLEVEAQRAMAYGEELDKAYLAKAFAFESESDISNMYLEKICSIDKKGEPCLLTEIIKFWADKDWKSADQLLKDKQFKSPYVKVWIIKHYDKIQKYDELIGLTETLWPNKSLNDFIGKYKTLTLWKTDKVNESKELFQNTYAYLPEEQKVSFLSDICNLEIEKSCSKDSLKACTLLVDKMKSYADTELLEEEALLTYIKTNKCGITEIDDIISELRVQIDDPKIQMYLAAVRAQSMGKKTVAEQIYKSILKTTSESSSLSYEVRGNLVETISKEDFSEQIKWWLSVDAKSFYHQNLGVKLLRILSDKKEWQMAEPIAQKLIANHSYFAKEQNEIMAIVFYNLKKYNVAKKIIQSMDQKSTRDIASQNEFKAIRNKLMNSNFISTNGEGEK